MSHDVFCVWQIKTFGNATFITSTLKPTLAWSLLYIHRNHHSHHHHHHHHHQNQHHHHHPQQATISSYHYPFKQRNATRKGKKEGVGEIGWLQPHVKLNWLLPKYDCLVLLGMGSPLFIDLKISSNIKRMTSQWRNEIWPISSYGYSVNIGIGPFS